MCHKKLHVIIIYDIFLKDMLYVVKRQYKM